MTSDQKIELIEDYETRFGDMPEDLQPQNWISQPEWFSAMEQALKTGVAMTTAYLTRRMGEPFWEEER